MQHVPIQDATIAQLSELDTAASKLQHIQLRMHTTATDMVHTRDPKTAHCPGHKPSLSAMGSPVIQAVTRQCSCITSMVGSPQLQANDVPRAHAAAANYCESDQEGNQ